MTKSRHSDRTSNISTAREDYIQATSRTLELDSEGIQVRLCSIRNGLPNFVAAIDLIGASKDRSPLAMVGTKMSDSIVEMTAKGFGCVGITDADSSRNMGSDLDARVDEVVTRSPKTIRPDQLMSETLDILNTPNITTLFILDDGRRSTSMTCCVPVWPG